MREKVTRIVMFCLSIMYILIMKENVLANTQTNNWKWPTYVNIIKNDWPNYASGNYHGGTDFPVSLNTDVFSSCDGEVVSTQYLTTSYGKHVKIRAKVNGQIVYIRYCHLNQILVSEGQYVTAGQIIGKSGSTGNSTGPHLHYEVRNSADSYNNALNPKLYLPGTSYEFETIKSSDSPKIRFESLSADNVISDNATISAWGRNEGDMQEIGFYIGMDGAYQNQSRVVVSRNVSWTDFYMNYDINAYYGKLNPGQAYKYSFFCVKDGNEYKSDEAIFTTAGDNYVSFDSFGTEDISFESARIKCWLSNPKGCLLSSVGFEIGTGYNADDKKTYEVFQNVLWTRSELNISLADYCGQLTANTNYVVRFYADFGTIRYYSDCIIFETKTKEVFFDDVVINDITDNNATLSVWFTNSGTINEIGLYIGDSEHVQDRVVYNGTDVAWTRANIIMNLSAYWRELQPGQTYTYVFYVKKGSFLYNSNIRNSEKEG